jgi:hypothetical protein
MTPFYKKMTPLLEETSVSTSDWRESAISLPGFGGLLHAYSGGSAGTPEFPLVCGNKIIPVIAHSIILVDFLDM